MKIEGLPGEFGFKALYRLNNLHGWLLSDIYFLGIEEAALQYGEHVKWPVTVNEDGSVYIPDQTELQ